MKELILLFAVSTLIACAAPRPMSFQCPTTPGKMDLNKFIGALSECADLASK